MLDASAGSVRSSDSRLADAVTAWSERPYPVRPDDLTSWILHAAEPTA